jgi:hypothetical protein
LTLKLLKLFFMLGQEESWIKRTQIKNWRYSNKICNFESSIGYEKLQKM